MIGLALAIIAILFLPWVEMGGVMQGLNVSARASLGSYIAYFVPFAYPIVQVWTRRPLARTWGLISGGFGVVRGLVSILGTYQTTFGVRIPTPSVGPYVYILSSVLVIAGLLAYRPATPRTPL